MSKLDALRKRAALVARARQQARAKQTAAQRVPGALAQRKTNGGTQDPSPTAVTLGQGPRVIDRIAIKRERARLLDNPGQYQEIRRICNLPIKEPWTDERVEAFNRDHLLASSYADGFRLWGIQCEGVTDYAEEDGLFGAIGVGWGKTILFQMIAEVAYSKKKLKRMMVMVPSQVLNQLVKVDFPFARKRIPISYPVHVLGGKSMKARLALAKSGKKGLYVMPYSCLSTKDTTEVLEAIRPELIICDEADKLGNRRAARTKRVMNYVNEYEPQGVCLSGTITSKSIKDYWHLIKWCLKESCPLPLSSNLASEWATKIDAQASSSEASGPIVPLIEWAMDHFPEEEITEDTAGFRRAYRIRLRTAPGAVASGDLDIGPSLIINNLPVKNPAESEGWETLEHFRRQVVESFLTPNGDEIDHAIHTYKWLYELTAGFYNELTFPDEQEFADRCSISEEDAEEILELARGHRASAQLLNSEMRKWIDTFGRELLDTPMFVGLSMSKHGAREVGDQLYSVWLDHKNYEEDLTTLMLSTGAHKGTMAELRKKITRSLRDSRIVRVCPYKIDHAVRWAESLPKGKGGIIWVKHQGIGVWVTEALRHLDPVYCPAGDEYNAVLQADNLPKIQDRVIVASMNAHGTGKNLQAFANQLFLQWPRSAKLAEQTLGRMHRNGQKADEVWAHTCNTSEFDQMCFAACLNDSLYIHQSTGNRQKLIYSTYSPGLPKVFPSAVLRERGFQNKKLTVEQQRFMKERFGA